MILRMSIFQEKHNFSFYSNVLPPLLYDQFLPTQDSSFNESFLDSSRYFTFLCSCRCLYISVLIVVMLNWRHSLSVQQMDFGVICLSLNSDHVIQELPALGILHNLSACKRWNKYLFNFLSLCFLCCKMGILLNTYLQESEGRIRWIMWAK